VVRDRPCENTGASRLFCVNDFGERCNEKEARNEKNEFCKVGGEDCEAGRLVPAILTTLAVL